MKSNIVPQMIVSFALECKLEQIVSGGYAPVDR